MKVLTRRHGNQNGLTLVETLASIFIFAVMTVGVVPLLSSSLRGANSSRAYTMGKNVVQEAMERARGLPYFIQNTVTTSPKRLDLLDLYFPNRTAGSGGGTGYYSTGFAKGWTNYGPMTYATVCTSAASSNPACPKDLFATGNRIPPGYTLTFRAQFVKPVAPVGSSPETYTPVAPATGYTWTSTSGGDIPPSRLLQLSITANWVLGGNPDRCADTVGAQGCRTFTMTSLIGERKVGSLKVQGSGKLNYAVQVSTRFSDATGNVSQLIAPVGHSDSDIQVRLLASATQDILAGEARLTQEASLTSPALLLGRIVGAAATTRAPPDQTPPAVTGTEATLLHPGLASRPVAFLGNSQTENTAVAVGGDLPVAQGGFRFLPGGTNSTQYNFWLNNQSDTSATSPLRLDPDLPVFYVSPTGGSAVIRGSSSARSTSLTGGDRKVEATAAAAFDSACIFPVTYIPSNAGASRPCIVRIAEFSANVLCRSTTSSTTTATGTYSVTIRYYQDTVNNGINDGSYVSKVISVTSGTTAADVLTPVKTSPPLVYDSTDDLQDLYLFPVQTGQELTTPPGPSIGPRKGFIQDWSQLTSIPTQLGTGNRSTGAQINGAVQITTTPTDPNNNVTALTLSVGSLSCAAVDNR